MIAKGKMIAKAQGMRPSAEQESFYRFAMDILIDLKAKGIKDTKFFYDEIQNIKRHKNTKTFRTALGISGKNVQTLELWCDGIKAHSRSTLGGLDIDELCSVMGYCARISKYKEAVGNVGQN